MNRKEDMEEYIKEHIKFPNSFTEIDKINYLQRKIIICSMAYYLYDNSFVSDFRYDSLCQCLVNLQNEYKGDIKTDSKYGYAYDEFDGSTGYFLSYKLTKYDYDYLNQLTQHIISINKENNKSKNKLF